MYADFFGLRTLPFEDRADTQFFYPTAESQEALTALVYEIHHGTGLGLLIGEAGTGKTLLLRSLLLRLEKSHQTVVVTWPVSGVMDLVRECCKGFGVTLPPSLNQSHTLNRLRRHLGRCAGAGIRSILIIDQAQNLSLINIAQLAALAELCGERGRLLNVILAAQPLVRALLDRPEFGWIRQQLLGERTLSPFTQEETGRYIRHRLQIAGAGVTRLFDDLAIPLIHEVSEGVPRLINRVCHAAMQVAFAAQTPQIPRTIVEAVSNHGGSSLTVCPVVRERTIAARELGSAKIGVGIGPWLGVTESPDRLANSDGSPMTTGPIDPSPQRSRALGLPVESPVIPAVILNHDEVDDTESDANATSGASIVDGECDGFNGEYFVSGPNKGTLLLARLERAMARAEQMTSITEASFSRLTAVEQRLASLVEQAERQTEKLRGMGEDTTTRLAKLIAETERATQTIHEWVEEAVRTHSCLERTLSEYPPIPQTHPTDAVRRISRIAEPFAGITTESASGQLQVLPEPDFDTMPVEPRVAKPPTQAQKIAQLISEALRQEASAPV